MKVYAKGECSVLMWAAWNSDVAGREARRRLTEENAKTGAREATRLQGRKAATFSTEDIKWNKTNKGSVLQLLILLTTKQISKVDTSAL